MMVFMICRVEKSTNMRVRALSANRAMIEIDKDLVDSVNSLLPVFEESFRGLGFHSLSVRPFKSGSLSGRAVDSKTN